MGGATDPVGITDSVIAKLGKVTEKLHIGGLVRPRMRPEHMGIVGWVEVKLIGPDGNLKYHEIGRNLVTDNGDEEIARRIADDATDIVTGMRLGTGVTAVAKNGAGANIVTYIATSAEALDAAATFSDKGAGLGFRTTHISTWIAGDITNPAITETVLTSETPITDAAGVLANVVARFLFAAAIDKQAGDSLKVTWHLDVLGA